MEKRMTVEFVADNDCTGCLSCVAVCKQSAISIKYNNEGFWFPVVNITKCTRCGMCYRKCPSFNLIEKKIPFERRVLQFKDHEILENCASGGAAFGMSSYILKKGGWVCGCVLDENMLPIHILTEKYDDLKKMRGSKYVQSMIGKDVYEQVKTKAKENHPVLFIGTPCQVAGVITYIGDVPESLITVEVICHGVAGPGLYAHYIMQKSEQLKGKLKDVQFRSRRAGRFPNNHSIMIITDCQVYCKNSLDDPYGSSFYHNRILRESCYRCIYATPCRVADITIGDYDAPKSDVEKFSSTLGFSIALINSKKGKKFIEDCKYLFDIIELRETYSQINLIQPTLRPRQRDEMKKMHVDMSNPLNDVGYDPKITIIDRIKRLIPQEIKDSIKKKIKR